MRIRSLTLAAVTAATLAGCASGGEPVPVEPGEKTIVVHNNEVGATSLTVYLVSELGNRQMLGSLQPGTTERFAVPNSAGMGQYRLIALSTGGRDVASRPFTLFNNASLIEWDIAMRDVNVRRAQPSTP